MYVRVCRYRVQAELTERFLAVQQRATELYRRFGGEHVTYYQSQHDPGEWMEIHHYPSESACATISARLGQQPEVISLWEQFQATLDPYFPLVVEEYHQRGWLSAEQANNVFEDELGELLPDSR